MRERERGKYTLMADRCKNRLLSISLENLKPFIYYFLSFREVERKTNISFFFARSNETDFWKASVVVLLLRKIKSNSEAPKC